MSLVSTLKSVLLPKGPAPRRLRLGAAAGVVMNIDFAHQTRLYLGLYERVLTPHFRRLARPGTACFDVGANIGYDTLMLARLTGAPVVAFECDAGCAAGLRTNAALNSFAIRVVEARVAARPGDGLTTLDAAAESFGPPGFVKMDIEGGEVDALLGAASLLALGKTAWIVETHGAGLETRCLEILDAAGCATTIIEQPGFLGEHRPDAHNRWIVATPRSQAPNPAAN